MNEDKEFLRPIVVATLIVIMFCLVMLTKGINPENYKISVIVSNSSEGRWVPFKAGLEQAAKDNGIELDYVYTDYIDNIQEEVSLINSRISQGADGVIAEFCLSEGIHEIVSSISARVPVEFVVTTVEADADVRGNHATVAPDNYAVGRAIGNELVIDLKNRSEEESIKVGMVSGNQKQFGMQQRLKGFMDATENLNLEIVWNVSESRYTDEDIEKSDAKNPAEVIVCLDNDSMEKAVDYCSKANTENKSIYGSGCSEKLVYYIDSGMIDSMILTNDFSMGYQSLSDLALKLQNRTSVLEDREISFSVVNKDNLFGEDNQQILFPIVR
ncbi:monosaccharide ABC transporter substrate-binding protein, CUT2 family [Oribacterium sp. KHPX15]|uniref:sugar ABC transporter substrate-binding protein n=1 Tax=Oribacterium sp. KHPX15 TaxID=1855342 RepID=UPI00089CAB55|nr:sugar ABC transporter substrate-binding protein [Oribacterium sp. KHPX15]SEA13098.1 monosaccharide ABC transporter substrate-binding protein, CUT2 family [Oribacterium sp. KHPX15]